MSFFRFGERVLVPMDLGLLFFVFERKVATIDQIRNVLFPNVTVPIVSRRISRLVRSNVLERDAIPIGSRTKRVIKLGSKALPHLQEHYPLAVERATRGSASVIHDLELSNLVSFLEGFGSVERILTENVIQSCGAYSLSPKYGHYAALRSDGVLEMGGLSKGVHFAIEYDRTSKSEPRYLEKIKDYYNRKSVKGVLYFVTDESTLKLLQRVEADFRTSEEAKFYFHLMGNDFYNSTEVIFKNAEGIPVRID